MFACEDSESIVCARLMRGTRSIASVLTLRSASCRTASRFLCDHMCVIKIAPGLNKLASWTPSAGLCCGG
jgi:hypothetical protein